MKILAICYDFDRTLSPEEMQAQGYIQSLGYTVKDFWDEADALAEERGMDGNLAYMYLMVERSKGRFPLTKKTLNGYGSRVRLYNGVEGWFSRINAYGQKRGVAVEHYVISSGLKEMIEGTSVAGEFTQIYASSFMYGGDGAAVWAAQAVNYTTKTQYLFRISKGVTNVNDERVNDLFGKGEYRVPFTRMAYIGDSATDIPCMKLLRLNGGLSVGVFDPVTGDRKKVAKMLAEGRIDCAQPADYTEGSGLDTLIKSFIDKVSEP